MECWSNGVLVFINRLCGFVGNWVTRTKCFERGVHHSTAPTLHYSVVLVWSPRLVSRQRLLLFREALICLSYLRKWKWSDGVLECWGVVSCNTPALHCSITPI